MKTKHLIFLTPAPRPACSTECSGAATPRRSEVWSGNGRWRASLGVRAGSGTEQVRRRVEPNHALGLVIGRRDGRLRRVDGRAGVKHTANRAASVMRAVLAGGICLTGLSLRRSGIVVANDG